MDLLNDFSESVSWQTLFSMLRRHCPGFGWDNFLHRGLHGAMLWICDANSGDNTLLF